ncbi:cytochrome c biogenesis CcdA family protein [Mycobacterium spongiae]|uniref:Cytochrome c biogenesis protein CcdA n=1 Tax=Mycobacterium spongiae TaxID=886343 RepID=A0A975JZP4_9MYCO|nr:cytochrome c biogenesis protein CcdA [Mycobacterium spongiae]QUR68687.1 cytochrome c biogenesis protein CcdA [Mycobacterium spongiae]
MIDTTAIGFALGAGLVAALNPCGFAFLPGYLSLVIAGGNEESSRAVVLARAGAATVAMSAGFVTVFGIFGVLISPLIASAQRYLPFATVIIGALLVTLGVWLLVGKSLTVMLPKAFVGTPTARLRSMYGYGVGYAIASLSCTIAPFLAVISMTFKRGSMFTGVVAFLAYATGMAITVGVAALVVALAGSAAAGGLRRILPHASRIAGAIVLLTGLYVVYYGYYEIRLFFTDASPDDPIVRTAGLVQGWLARHVDALGIWPMLGALVVLTAIAIGWGAVRRRGERSLPADDGAR